VVVHDVSATGTGTSSVTPAYPSSSTGTKSQKYW